MVMSTVNGSKLTYFQGRHLGPKLFSVPQKYELYCHNEKSSIARTDFAKSARQLIRFYIDSSLVLKMTSTWRP